MSESVFICPHCEGLIHIARDEADEAFNVICPHCGELTSIDRANDPEAPADELDGVRIRQLATLRRALYRSRSHAVIAMCVCVVATIELTRRMIDSFSSRLTLWGIGYAFGAVVTCYAMVHAYRRAIALHRECKSRTVSKSPQSSDFSTLGDGSDTWRRLENIDHR